MVDNMIAIINIFSISACVTLAVTWYPLAKKTITSRNSTMIGVIGIGLVLTAITTGAVRQYSFLMREMEMWWLRDSYVAPAVLAAQAAGLVLLAISYYLPRESGRVSANHNYLGIYAGCATFFVMLLIKVVV